MSVIVSFIQFRYLCYKYILLTLDIIEIFLTYNNYYIIENVYIIEKYFNIA